MNFVFLHAMLTGLCGHLKMPDEGDKLAIISCFFVMYQ